MLSSFFFSPQLSFPCLLEGKNELRKSDQMRDCISLRLFIPQCGLKQCATSISAGRALERNKNKRALSLMKMEEAPVFSISAGCCPQRQLLALSHTVILSPHFLLLFLSQAIVTSIYDHVYFKIYSTAHETMYIVIR